MRGYLGMTMAGLLGSGVAFGETPKPTEAPKPTKELLEKGKTSYGRSCASCHGEKGDAVGPMAAVLNPKPRNFLSEPFKKGHKPEEIFKTVTEGLPGSTMVSFRQLTEEDRWALTYYVLDLRKPGSVLEGNKPKGNKPKGGKSKGK